VWDEGEDITFFPKQRRYVRIETDANSNYHDPINPSNSRINIISTDANVLRSGSTPLKGGRLRGIFEAPSNARMGATGIIRVELSRPGLPILADERTFRIVETPPIRDPERRVTLPPFEVIPVENMEAQLWADLSWPDNPNVVASSAQMSEGVLLVYYSEIFPNFRNRLARLEARDTSLGRSFTARYKIWLAVHSLLLYQDQQEERSTAVGGGTDQTEKEGEEAEQKERCRLATISAIFAQREVNFSQTSPESED
jgi:hypothetical protein